MDWTDVLGLTAGACVTIAVLPQIRKAFRTKKVEDVSPIMFLILLVGISLWVIYGVLQKDLPIIVTNGLSLCLNATMLYFIVKYRKK